VGGEGGGGGVFYTFAGYPDGEGKKECKGKLTSEWRLVKRGKSYGAKVDDRKDRGEVRGRAFQKNREDGSMCLTSQKKGRGCGE